MASCICFCRGRHTWLVAGGKAVCQICGINWRVLIAKWEKSRI